MTEPPKCKCKAHGNYDLVDDDKGFPQKVYRFDRCDRCKKRDDLWDEMVGMLKWHSAAWKDESYEGMAEDTDILLARCGDAT